jgi:hypothetical protein
MVHDDATRQLNIEGPELGGSQCGYTDQAVGLGQKALQGLAAASAAAKLQAALPELDIIKPAKLRFPVTDAIDLQRGPG